MDSTSSPAADNAMLVKLLNNAMREIEELKARLSEGERRARELADVLAGRAPTTSPSPPTMNINPNLNGAGPRAPPPPGTHLYRAPTLVVNPGAAPPAPPSRSLSSLAHRASGVSAAPTFASLPPPPVPNPSSRQSSFVEQQRPQRDAQSPGHRRAPSDTSLPSAPPKRKRAEDTDAESSDMSVDEMILAAHGETPVAAKRSRGSWDDDEDELAGDAPPPPTGQRQCRQCGQPGRYKDGKCVEKWGPGPAGPGTVCDRCRKKMKRVEKRAAPTPTPVPAPAPAPAATFAYSAGSPSMRGVPSPPTSSVRDMPVRESAVRDESPRGSLPDTSREAHRDSPRDVPRGSPHLGARDTVPRGSPHADAPRSISRDTAREREREREWELRAGAAPPIATLGERWLKAEEVV